MSNYRHFRGKGFPRKTGEPPKKNEGPRRKGMAPLEGDRGVQSRKNLHSRRYAGVLRVGAHRVHFGKHALNRGLQASRTIRVAHLVALVG
jgi:hypothetical protein